MKRNEYITNPLRVCFGIFKEYCWDGALTQTWDLSRDTIGPHAICDVDGNSLELSDVKDGMSVKIRAKHLSIGLPIAGHRKIYVGYDYLYTAYGLYGKYLAINNIQF